MKTLIKQLALAAGFLYLCTIGFSQQVAKSIPNSTSPDGLIGFLEFRPADYGSQKHPLIIFLHGIGERGNGTSQINAVTANAIPKFCAAGASMQFTVGGQTSSFVVLSPQLSVQYGYWPTFYVKEMIKYAKANLQIDTNRIYVTGLSLGGGGVWRAITEVMNSDYSFDAGIAAAAPCCGTQEEIDANVCSTIAANHLPVWAFHSMDDGTVGVGCTQHAEILMSWCTGITPAGKFTYYQSGGHGGAWTNAFDTGHITTVVNGGGSFTASPNLYEWFLSHTRATAPVANPGPSQTISATSTVVNAIGSYSPNGSITAYNWQQVSGPAPATITNANSPTATISNMVQGSAYTFKLTVTDIIGASGSAITDITITNTLLPVQYSYFTAQHNSNGNLLQWGTVTEQNSLYFAVERSDDGSRFTTVGKVTGAGTSSLLQKYTYTDTQAGEAAVYYRLRQVDKDGQFKFSAVVLVNNKKNEAAEQVYPNPVQNNLAVVINNNASGKGNIFIYALTGNAVREQAVSKNEKSMTAIVDMNGLAPGVYIAKVTIGQYSFIKRILKN